MNNIFCTILTIGDELLIGQTIDTNSAWMAQQLNPLGFVVKKRIAVCDNREDILDSIHLALKESDVLLITGGLGPTNDDITRTLLAEYFDSPLVIHQPTLDFVRSYFEKRKRPILQINLDQALVPSKALVLENAVGTAPGMLFRKEGKVIVAMPGVPFEMQYIMSNHVLPFLQKEYQTPNFLHRTLVTSGEGESFIANRLKDFESSLPANIKLAYLPKLGIVKLRLTGTDVEEQILNSFFDTLKRQLQPITVIDQDLELEQVIASILKEKNQTLALAESCTGGFLASLFTSIKGASLFFKGSAVTYMNDVKTSLLGITTIHDMNQVAVSEELAREMAQNIRVKTTADYGLGIVGYLEKNDHDNEVWVAVSDEHRCESKMFRVPYDRQKNTVLASNTALNFLLHFIRS